MRERPILFSAPMVRALLAGTKTQTRRVCKLDYRPGMPEPELHSLLGACPYGAPGGRLWVRETWMPDAPRNGEWPDTQFFGCGMSPLSLIPECYRKPWHCLHRATYEGYELVGWKPSIHMPRWASRITLEITGVRVERLQDISEADAIAEGVTSSIHLPGGRFANENFAHLWWTINGDGSWDANPWVWVVQFKRIGG